MSLKVADLFSGAGGFSEGFRQVGFDVSFAADVWTPAVQTHQHNHPSTRVVTANVMALTPSDIGPVDVLIGSPPCTFFSMSNKAGGGDASAGMRLVHRFLYFVAVLEPKWWLMENVPRILQHLPSAGERIPYARLGLNRRGSLLVPRVALLDSADFGVPQHRVRAFIGNYPDFEAPPRPFSRRTLGHVVSAFPNPVAPIPTGKVQDPLYPLALEISDLTDHFGRWTVLSPKEISENVDLKLHHGFYGRMSFPDNLRRPARTQMATMHRVAREVTVVDGCGTLRLLTVREAASVQGFPIAYQWIGSSIAQRYRLVGNAVPPPMARAFAAGIVRIHRPRSGLRIRPLSLAAVPVVQHADETPRRREDVIGALDRVFHWPVPGVRSGVFRVELDNLRRPGPPHRAVRGPRSGTVRHIVAWRATLHKGTGKGYYSSEYRLSRALTLLRSCGATNDDMHRLVAGACVVGEELPDATTLQCTYVNRIGGFTPKDILHSVARIVESVYPEVSESHPKRGRVSRRIGAALVVCAVICEFVNFGGHVEADGPYIPVEWVRRGVKPAPTSTSDAVGLRIANSLARALQGPRFTVTTPPLHAATA